jgi:heterodisulfide reductase subunit C
MELIQQIAFLIISVLSIRMFSRRMMGIRRNILMGRDRGFESRGKEGWKQVVLLALGQRKMFRNPLAAILHLVIYAGFIIINIEVLEILLDGVLGTHRLFAPLLGAAYPWLINGFEWLAAGVILVCIIFLARRYMTGVPRFRGTDLDGWPRSDARNILIAEIILMSLFLTMNAADTMLQSRGHVGYAEHPTGDFSVSVWIHPILIGLSDTCLVIIERSCWWLHILGIYAFLNYLPWSKHLHILLAFPNAYYARPNDNGRMDNMPEIQREVLYAMQPELAPAEPAGEAPKRFGAKDVFDLSAKSLLDAYSCTECGRCSSACPASMTGKKLSPRRIMMATRDRLEEVGKIIDERGQFEDDGRSLLRDHISEEELRACTTCNACVEECPVSIRPVDIILEMRRYLVMEESNAPNEWTMMFGNTENNFAPWKFSPDDRARWAEEEGS